MFLHVKRLLTCYYFQFLRFGPLALRSRFIGEPLPFDAQQRALGAGGVINPKLDAIGVAKIELREIAVKVLFAAVLINPDHAALEDAVKTLNGVGGDQGSGRTVMIGVFLARVINLAMRGELFSDLGILSAFVGHDVRFASDVGANDRRKIILLDAFDMERAGCATPFNKGQNSILVAVSLFDCDTLLVAEESLMNFHGGSIAAHRREIASSHRFANAVSEKPSGFHAAFEHPLNLAGRDAFLAGAHQVNNLKPKMQRQVRAFKDGSLSNGELALALVAIVKAKARGLAFHLANALRVSIAAVRAYGAVWPQLALDIRESGGFIVEAGSGENWIGHGDISYGFNPTSWGSLCQV
jgi:hypothetical protein